MRKLLPIVLILMLSGPVSGNAPQRLWTLNFSKGFFGSPVIAGELAYAGCLDSALYAVNTRTGKIRWKVKTGGEIRSTPAMSGEKLLVVNGEGKLYCLNRQTGAVTWSFVGDGDRKYELYTFADYFQSSPVVDGNLVYFGSGDGYVYAVGLDDGVLAWRFKTGGIVHSTVAVSGKRVFAGSFDGNVYGLDKFTGVLSWKFKSVGQRFFPKGEMQGALAARNGLVYGGSRDYNFYALNDSLGYAEWNRSFDRGWAMSPPVFIGNTLYIGTSDDHLLLACDARTGAVLWKTNLKFNIFGAPAISGGKLYVGTLMGRLYGIDQKTGSIEWFLNSPGFERFRADYFKADESYLDDIAGRLGKPEQYLDAMQKLGSIFSTPAVTADQKLIVTTAGGEMICFG